MANFSLRKLAAGGLLLYSSLAHVAEPAHAPAASDTRPNILLLFAEDMSSHLGAFGDDTAVTPNLDKLANEGVRFTNTFTTASICAPSRSSLLTGVHQIAIGTQHMRTSHPPTRPAYKSVPPAEIKAFPELLRAAGYYTFTNDKLDYQFSGTFSHSGPFTIWNAEGSSPFTIWDAEDRRKTGWEDRAEGQNFFGLVNFLVTHESGVFKPFGNWPNSVVHLLMQIMHELGDYEVGEGPVTGQQMTVPPYYPDTPTVRDDLARHYNNIYQMDLMVGKIMDRLETQGLLDNTIVIFTSDHGDGLPRSKRSLYDTGLKVPMIIRWPERYRPAHLSPGQEDSRMISFVDLMPTILTIAGVETPEHAVGQNFLTASPLRDTVFASQDRVDMTYDRQRAIRDQRYKYIRSWYPEQPLGYSDEYRDNQDMMREMLSLQDEGKLNTAQASWFKPPGEEQVYDTVNDPFELNNLAGNPEHQAIKNRLRKALGEWLEQTGDWSEQHEDEMVDGFLQNGKPRITTTPNISVAGNNISIACGTQGASIGYRLDDGAWQLYTAPFTAATGVIVTAKAVRYGWEESEEESLPAP